MEPRERVYLLDALRGFAVCLMILHHALFDLYYFFHLPQWLYTNPVFNVLQVIFACVFILISGIMCQYSRNNLKRGIVCIVVAYAITLVTSLVGIPDRFGVLHMLGFSMLLYGLTEKLWKKVSIKPTLLVCILSTILTIPFANGIQVSVSYLYPIGLVPKHFVTADFYPMLPWMFVFFTGALLGNFVKNHQLPNWFYSYRCIPMEKVGKKALILYVVHQPILLGIMYAVQFLLSRE